MMIAGSSGCSPVEGSDAAESQTRPAQAAPSAADSRERIGMDWLVLDFPDGVRGGRGAIQGVGSRPRLPHDPSPPFFTGHDPSALDWLLQQVRDCGAVEPRVGGHLSHSFFVVSRSTDRDREVVRCLIQAIPHHFDAGLAEGDDIQTLLQMDRSPFREFESNPPRRPRQQKGD